MKVTQASALGFSESRGGFVATYQISMSGGWFDDWPSRQRCKPDHRKNEGLSVGQLGEEFMCLSRSHYIWIHICLKSDQPVNVYMFKYLYNIVLNRPLPAGHLGGERISDRNVTAFERGCARMFGQTLLKKALFETSRPRTGLSTSLRSYFVLQFVELGSGCEAFHSPDQLPAGQSGVPQLRTRWRSPWPPRSLNWNDPKNLGKSEAVLEAMASAGRQGWGRGGTSLIVALSYCIDRIDKVCSCVLRHNIAHAEWDHCANIPPDAWPPLGKRIKTGDHGISWAYPLKVWGAKVGEVWWWAGDVAVAMVVVGDCLLWCCLFPRGWGWWRDCGHDGGG